MQNFLTEEEIVKIEAMCSDKVLLEAVRKVMLAGIYTHGVVQQGHDHNPLINGAYNLVSLSLTNPIPDEILGQTLKAQWSGVNSLKSAFDELEKIKSKKVTPVETPYNEAV